MLTKQEQEILEFLDECDIEEGDIEKSGVMLDLTMIRDFVPKYLRKKQGKTVVDAVNAWGEFELAPSSGVETFRYCPADDSIMGCHYKAEASDGLVCTIEEFNQCVKEMSFHNVSSAEFMDYQLGVKIPLEPIKPRTKVEYVKVEFDHIWEGIKAMEVGGETYFVDGNEDVQYIEIGNVPAFMRPLAMKEAIYRKVETEITWQDEVREFIAGCEEISVNTSFTEVLTYGYLNGELTKEACNDDSQIAFVDEFIEMCNLVTSLTK